MFSLKKSWKIFATEFWNILTNKKTGFWHFSFAFSFVDVCNRFYCIVYRVVKWPLLFPIFSKDWKGYWGRRRRNYSIALSGQRHCWLKPTFIILKTHSKLSFLQSNLCTTTILGIQIQWTLLTGGCYSKVTDVMKVQNHTWDPNTVVVVDRRLFFKGHWCNKIPMWDLNIVVVIGRW